MHTDCTSLPAHWDYYLRRSLEADAARYDDLGHGREEQLEATIAAIKAKQPFGPELTARLDRLPWNRAKKHRRLRGYLTASSLGEEHLRSPADVLITLDLAAVVRRALSPEEWRIELRLSLGETYAAVAASLGLSAPALKVRVHRWRERLRVSRVAD